MTLLGSRPFNARASCVFPRLHFDWYVFHGSSLSSQSFILIWIIQTTPFCRTALVCSFDSVLQIRGQPINLVSQFCVFKNKGTFGFFCFVNHIILLIVVTKFCSGRIAVAQFMRPACSATLLCYFPPQILATIPPMIIFVVTCRFCDLVTNDKRSKHIAPKSVRLRVVYTRSSQSHHAIRTGCIGAALTPIGHTHFRNRRTPRSHHLRRRKRYMGGPLTALVCAVLKTSNSPKSAP